MCADGMGYVGTFGNKDSQLASWSILIDFTDEALIISTNQALESVQKCTQVEAGKSICYVFKTGITKCYVLALAEDREKSPRWEGRLFGTEPDLKVNRNNTMCPHVILSC